jgi:hypothetical protein
MKITVFWDVTPCRSYMSWCFGGTYCLHIQGRKIRERETSVSMWQKTAEKRSSETSVHTRSTRRHILEDGIFLCSTLLRDTGQSVIKSWIDFFKSNQKYTVLLVYWLNIAYVNWTSGSLTFYPTTRHGGVNGVWRQNWISLPPPLKVNCLLVSFSV